MNYMKYGCAYCNEIIEFECGNCESIHDSSKIKYCEECNECTNDMYHEYCPQHNIKYIITDTFYTKRLCTDCLINPNKKTRYCVECCTRHNIKYIEFCKICNTCSERNNNKYKHCENCNTCYIYIDNNNKINQCLTCVNLLFDDNQEMLNILNPINIQNSLNQNNIIKHNFHLMRSNSMQSNETIYSQLNLSDIDFIDSSSEEEV